MATMKPLLRLRDLDIGFRKGETLNLIVRGFNLEILENETVALVGESGCGKTVTAQSILRLYPERWIAYPRGQILFEGRDVLSMPLEEVRRIRGDRISMVFQEPMTSLNPLHTV
jgi:microcin C transport system ATP-binding protein